MPELFPFKIVVAGPARRDIAAITRWTLSKFGEAATLRYEALISQALHDIGADPQRPGAKARSDLLIDGAYTYHLAFSRNRMSGVWVKMPRHFILYRLLAPSVIEVGRILHDSRDLVRHLPQDYRRSEAAREIDKP